MRKLTVAVLSACVLAACGGGGGGGDSGWLSFDRNPVHVTMYEGESPEVRLTGTASSEPEVSINIGVSADPGIFDPNSADYERDGYSATFHARLLPSLTVGTHTGYIEVRVCDDLPDVCAQPYDASPWRVPVVVDVLANPGNPTSPTNGDFSGGMSSWRTYVWGGASASFSTTGGELHANISNGGTSIFGVELEYTGGLDLVAGRRYRLSFAARADAARTIEAWVDEGRDRDGDNTGTIYIQPPPTFTLGTTPQTFSKEFTMPETNRAAGIFFILGGSTADVYLDDVTVTEVTN